MKGKINLEYTKVMNTTKVGVASMLRLSLQMGNGKDGHSNIIYQCSDIQNRYKEIRNLCIRKQ